MALEASHKILTLAELKLHLAWIYSVLLHSFICLHAGLPLLLSIIGFVWLEVQVHLRCCLTLLLEDPQPLLVGQVAL